MVFSLVVRARGLEYGGREFESRSLHLKPETQLREERGLSGCRKGLKTVPLAQALLRLKPARTNNKNNNIYYTCTPYYFILKLRWAEWFILTQKVSQVNTKREPCVVSRFLTWKLHYNVCCFAFAGLRLSNAWASGTVLRPFLQPESTLSSRSLVSGFKCKFRDSNSQPPILEAARSNHYTNGL